VNIQKYNSRIVDYVDASELPLDLAHNKIYDYALNDEYSIVDYSDGDFYYVVDFAEWTSYMSELKALLPEDVIARNKFAIYFTQ